MPSRKGIGWALLESWDELDTFWQVGMAVTRSTKDAGQLAEQLGGPRRDSPSNNPLREPHRLGTIWFGEEDLVHSHVVHLLPKGTGHLQNGIKKSPGLLRGNMLLGQGHQLGMDVPQRLIAVMPGHR